MALGMTTKCVKYVLFAFNIIFWLSGSVVLAIGLWLRFSDQTRTIFELEGSNRSFYTGVHIFIAAGALMVVVGFLGCCGAIRQSQCMLGLYFAFLLVIFAMEMAAAIWCFKKKEKIIKDLQDFYTNTYTDYLETKQESSLKTLKVFHYALTCCGLTGSEESLLSRTCPVKDGVETVKSCPVAIDTFFKNKLQIIGAIALVAGLIMIFGMVFSMVLCCAIRHNRERV